jgi:CheY-like chemotaxis protein
MMPVMDGFTFIEACHREQLCDGVPIVVISAIQDALRRIAEVPVHACMAKPFDLDDLVRVVGQYAGSRSNGSRQA